MAPEPTFCHGISAEAGVSAREGSWTHPHNLIKSKVRARGRYEVPARRGWSAGSGVLARRGRGRTAKISNLLMGLLAKGGFAESFVKILRKICGNLQKYGLLH